jgi:alanine racemase
VLTDLARPNIFEIDLGVVARNTAAIRKQIGAKTFFFATVKADAYGFGLLRCVPPILAAGADGLTLSNFDDAVRLRQAGVKQPILVYAGAWIGSQLVDAACEHDLMFALHSEEAIARFVEQLGSRVGNGRRVRVGIKVEVGPERLGIAAEALPAAVAALRRHPNVALHVLHCHPNFPAGKTTPAALQYQYDRFVNALRALERDGIEVPLKVLASSKVLDQTGGEMVLNAVDPGSALFGLDAEGRSPWKALRTKLLQSRMATRKEYLADSPFPLRPDMRMGVIPIGYSDGVHRANCGQVIIREKRVPIVGKPSLEYTRIDLTAVPEAREGDEVVIIGAQGKETIAPEEVRRAQGATRIQDVALEIRPTVIRRYLEEKR